MAQANGQLRPTFSTTLNTKLDICMIMMILQKHWENVCRYFVNDVVHYAVVA